VAFLNIADKTKRELVIDTLWTLLGNQFISSDSLPHRRWQVTTGSGMGLRASSRLFVRKLIADFKPVKLVVDAVSHHSVVFLDLELTTVKGFRIQVAPCMKPTHNVPLGERSAQPPRVRGWPCAHLRRMMRLASFPRLASDAKKRTMALYDYHGASSARLSSLRTVPTTAARTTATTTFSACRPLWPPLP